MAERPVTYDHLRSRKKPATKKVRIVLDSNLAEEYETAKEAFEVAKNRAGVRPDDEQFKTDLATALAEVDKLKAKLKKESVEFVFRSIGHKRFDKLVSAHPPTPEQVKKYKDEGAGDTNWNVETFPPALIFQCLVSPEWTEEEVQDMWNSDDWSGDETMTLFLTAFHINSGTRTVVDLGKD